MRPAFQWVWPEAETLRPVMVYPTAKCAALGALSFCVRVAAGGGVRRGFCFAVGLEPGWGGT